MFTGRGVIFYELKSLEELAKESSKPENRITSDEQMLSVFDSGKYVRWFHMENKELGKLEVGVAFTLTLGSANDKKVLFKHVSIKTITKDLKEILIPDEQLHIVLAALGFHMDREVLMTTLPTSDSVLVLYQPHT